MIIIVGGVGFMVVAAYVLKAFKWWYDAFMEDWEAKKWKNNYKD